MVVDDTLGWEHGYENICPALSDPRVALTRFAGAVAVVGGFLSRGGVSPSPVLTYRSSSSVP